MAGAQKNAYYKLIIVWERNSFGGSSCDICPIC